MTKKVLGVIQRIVVIVGKCCQLYFLMGYMEVSM